MMEDKNTMSDIPFSERMKCIPEFIRRCLTILNLNREEAFAYLSPDEFDDMFFEKLGNLVEKGVSGEIFVYMKGSILEDVAATHVKKMNTIGMPIITPGIKSEIRFLHAYAYSRRSLLLQ